MDFLGHNSGKGGIYITGLVLDAFLKRNVLVMFKQVEYAANSFFFNSNSGVNDVESNVDVRLNFLENRQVEVVTWG